MRKMAVLFILIILVLFVSPSLYAKAEEVENYDDTVDSITESIDFSAIEDFFEEYSSSFFTEKNFKTVLKRYLSGGDVINADGIIAYLFDFGSAEVKRSISIFIAVFAIAVLSGVFKAVPGERIKDAVFLVSNASASTLIFAECASVTAEISSFITDVNEKMQGVLPIFATLSVVSGFSAKAQALTPVCALVAQCVEAGVNDLIVPLTTLIFAFSAAGFIQGSNSLHKTRDCLSSIAKWGLGAVVAVFSLYTGVCGLSGAVKDGAALRALKFSVGTSVPVVGGFAKEGVELMITAGSAVKSCVGSLFVIVVACVFLKPLLRIAILSLSLKLLRVFASPFCENGFIDTVSGFQSAISVLVAVLISVLIVFLFVVYCLLFMRGGS